MLEFASQPLLFSTPVSLPIVLHILLPSISMARVSLFWNGFFSKQEARKNIKSVKARSWWLGMHCWPDRWQPQSSLPIGSATDAALASLWVWIYSRYGSYNPTQVLLRQQSQYLLCMDSFPRSLMLSFQRYIFAKEIFWPQHRRKAILVNQSVHIRNALDITLNLDYTTLRNNRQKWPFERANSHFKCHQARIFLTLLAF